MKKRFISHSAIEVISYRHRFPVKRIASRQKPRNRSIWQFALRCWLVAAGCSLLVGLTGCGQAGSGNTPGLEARTSTSGSAGQGGKTLIPAGQGDKPLAKSAGAPKVETDGDKNSSAPSIPDSVAKDFESPYARIRLQSLDYWANQGTKAPLDPLLEALEDEDEDVRAKAAKIAEQHWGIKQELD